MSLKSLTTKRLLIAVALFAVACAVVVAAVFMLRERRPPRVGLPLARAAEEGDAAALKSLIAAGADVNERDGGSTPLAYAARAGDTEAIKALLDAGADANSRDCSYWGWTPLINAIHKYRNAAARTLVERGADVNARAGGCAEKNVESGLSPLMIAAKYDNAEMVKFLLEHGADVRATYDGYTVLSYAVAGGSLGKLSDIDRAATHPCPVETVKLLLEKAPDLSVNRGVVDHATLYVIKKKCPEVARLLERRKPPPPPPAPDDRTTQASAAPGGARR
jgi:ankyrin repeat protein